ncbi:MAG: EAL domain-containing protein [Bosea sp.]|uniref:putative bifunctional diguanylate cyclase/phosphodiesterase n=1 Tax=Bosea sp. (in: a-proteobacteria) TaxID=1871050 RepID=UPI002385AC6A|nr:EAL domain-containing protein [Bosea sp. (in: a-proteobacteria)]
MSKVWNFIVKHRVSIQDLGLILAVVLVLAYIAFEVDIFVTQGSVPMEQKLVELDEALLLGGVLAIGLLIFAARRYMEQKREMARRIAAEGRARELAYQDPLTGLANRRQFEEALAMAAASPPAQGQVHAVFLLDLNGFKQINDTYGHDAGDEVLLAVAEHLLRAVRDGDLVARLGGDEFVLLAQHLMGPEAAANIATRIISGLGEPILTGRVEHRVATGIGIAFLPDDAQTTAEALRKADLALYRAKGERRSAFRFFEEEMDRLVRQREQMERELREALELDLIRPQFRPSIDLASGRVTGFEAVPSWIVDGVERFPPERFLTVAEETGLIHAIARRILDIACAAARDWPDDIMLSIDVLPAQLKDRSLGEGILAAIGAAGLQPARLEIDISESAIVHDLHAAKAALGCLRQAGVRVALDNFGTGYSNLYHIREFGFDKVKIDRRFVSNMQDEDAASVVRALAGLGQGLGVTVSADGIAGPGDAALLASGVSEGQNAAQLLSADAARLLAREGRFQIGAQ